MIHQGSFLSEESYCKLYNFMIRFYKIMADWHPVHEDNYELCILPYWGNPVDADGVYGFSREPLQTFSYETAVKGSDLAQEIATLLSGDWLYGAPDFSPYSIAKELIAENPQYSQQFDEVWSMIYMMQCLEMIAIDDVLDEEHGQVFHEMKVLF